MSPISEPLSTRRSPRSGLLWILFSPLALLMAAISAVRFDMFHNIQIILFGAWSACGVVSGIGRIAGALWAVRLQIILCWIAFAAFAVPAIVMIFYALQRSASDVVALLAIAAGVFLTGIPFLIYAKRRQRELRDAENRA